MNRLFKTALCSGVALAAVAASVPAFAQEITSSVRGTVVTPNGSPAAGYTVVVTDTRTGTRQTLTTNGNGVFSARSLTVGGPYTVRVSGGQYEDVLVTDIYTTLSSAVSLPITLSEAQSNIEEITVVASASTVTNLAIGPSSSFNIDEIRGLPSISRQVRDIIRVDPRVSIGRSNGGNGFGISCNGGNNRLNSFTIDGVRAADGFGLNASGNLARNTFPIPFDALGAASVEFSPVDVEYGQFTGCAINVTTKSGTNDFHGSAFFLYTGDSLQGRTLDGDQVIDEDVSFDDYNWGAELGGPIIEDKLFFYFAYEETDTADTQNNGPTGAGFANEEEITLDDANRIRDILSNQYGRDTLDIIRTLPETSVRYFGRIDWNINDNHRLEATYGRLEENNLEPDDFGFNGFSFGDNFEVEGSTSDTYAARLFSNWTDNFSTEIRVSRNDVVDLQNPLGGGEAQNENVPRIIVQNGQGDDIFVSGPGFFRSANALEYQVDQFKFAADYVYGNHTFTAGYELDSLDVFNLFIPNATGTIEFATIDDLEAGTASFINGSGSFTGDPNDAAANFQRNINTVYLQDEWQVTEALNVVLGLRYDWYTSDDSPIENPVFEQRYGFSNTQAFSGLDILQPRIGLTYQLPEDTFGDTQLSAGFGIFAGGDPTVLFANAFQNFGGAIGDGSSNGAGCTAADLNVLAGGSFGGIPQCILDQQIASATQNTGRVAAADPDLELPSEVRYNIGLSHYTSDWSVDFFNNWQVQVDFIYSEQSNPFDFVDLTLTPNGTILPDGRPQLFAIDPLRAGCNATFVGPRIGFNNVTAACNAGGDDQDILLTNDANGGGRTYSLSAQFSKEFQLAEQTTFDFRAGYAYLDATVGNPVNSSTDTSSFEEVSVALINNPPLAPSPQSNKHNIVISGTLRHDFVEDYTTQLSVFFRARSGSPFSYVYDNNTSTTLFGDSDNEERILLYVPTGPNDPLVDFSTLNAQGTTDEFFAFLERTGLSRFAGGIAPRNAFEQRWTTDLDLRFQQDIPLPWEGHRVQFFFNFENFLNFIDSGSNVQRFADVGDVAEAVPVLDAALSADGTQFIYSNFNPGNGNSAPTFNALNDRDVDDSVWRVQFGIRYEF